VWGGVWASSGTMHGCRREHMWQDSTGSLVVVLLLAAAATLYPHAGVEAITRDDQSRAPAPH
jgi:hypothetical protein